MSSNGSSKAVGGVEFDSKTHKKRSKQSDSQVENTPRDLVVATGPSIANSYNFNQIATNPVPDNTIALFQQARRVEIVLKTNADLVKKGADTIGASVILQNSDILAPIAQENKKNAIEFKRIIDENSHNLTLQLITPDVVHNVDNIKNEVGLIDSFLMYLRSSENISTIFRSFENPSENIKRELAALKTQGSEAQEVMGDILKSFSKINKQNAIFWGKVLIRWEDGHAHPQEESEESIDDHIFHIQTQLMKCDEFIADDQESLTCIRKKIERMRTGRIASWSVFGVTIGFGYAYSVYYLHSRHGISYSHPGNAVIVLSMLGGAYRKAREIYDENGELEDSWNKHYERFKRQHKAITELKFALLQSYANQNVGNLTITQGIVQAGVPMVQVSQQAAAHVQYPALR